MGIIDPDLIATRYRAELKEKVSGLNSTPRVIGLIANNDQVRDTAPLIMVYYKTPANANDIQDF